MQVLPSEAAIHSSIQAHTKVDNAHAIIDALKETHQFTSLWTQDSAEQQEAIILQN